MTALDPLINRTNTLQVENDTILRLKPGSILLTTLRSALRPARRIFKLIFLQAKYLIPLEAEAAGVWIM